MKHLIPSALCILSCGVCASLSGATFDVMATQVGGFFEDGTADNEPTFQNYYVGYSTLTKTAERRNFFYFDLSGVTDTITEASFSLILPFGGFIPGAGDGGEEIFVMSGTPFAGGGGARYGSNS